MAIDRGYGSGFNNTGRAKPSTPRARRARGSARPNTPLSQMSSKEYNARLTQGQGARRVQQRRNDISGNMLEAFTGFNRKDGVDAGDFAGLAISIPTGGLSGIARAVGRAVVPKAVRIAGAATRVAAKSKRATSALEATRQGIYTGIHASDEVARSLRSPEYVGADYYDSSTRMVDGLFDKWETTAYRRGAGETISAADRASQAAAGTGRRVVATQTQDYAGRATRYRIDPSASDLAEAARLEASRGGAIQRAYQVSQAAQAAQARSTTAAAAAEIRRRLAAIRKAKEAEKKAPKVNRSTGMPDRLEW